jgi:hypothetical protein
MRGTTSRRSHIHWQSAHARTANINREFEAALLRLAVLAVLWNCLDYCFGLGLFQLDIAYPSQPTADDRRINPGHVKCAAKLFIFKAS